MHHVVVISDARDESSALLRSHFPRQAIAQDISSHARTALRDALVEQSCLYDHLQQRPLPDLVGGRTYNMCFPLDYTLPCSCSATYAHLPVLAVIMRPDALHHLTASLTCCCCIPAAEKAAYWPDNLGKTAVRTLNKHAFATY